MTLGSNIIQGHLDGRSRSYGEYQGGQNIKYLTVYIKGESVINITRKSSDPCCNFVGQCFCPRGYFVLTIDRLYGNTSENTMRPIGRLINRCYFKRHQLSEGLSG